MTAVKPIPLSFLPATHAPSGMKVDEVDFSSAAGHRPFSASRFSVPPGATSELDQHDVAEMWMVAHGKGEVLSGDQKIEVGSGDLILLPGQVPHRLHNTGPDSIEVFSVWWNA
jgi:mannose-6-phosphate isomerase-like protein (cupin superfamily)